MDGSTLPISVQASLLGLNRSGLYYQPAPHSAEDLYIKQLIDKIYTRYPMYGYRRICWYLIMGNGTQAYAIAAEQPQRDNPLKHVEDTIEQNDNNFDGLINNTPQTPTVADFEQRAKAGEAISVTDLAKAVKAEKREQPQKKPSILKKLDEYKKQAAQQPKDKQKEHKKDLEV